MNIDKIYKLICSIGFILLCVIIAFIIDGTPPWMKLISKNGDVYYSYISSYNLNSSSTPASSVESKESNKSSSKVILGLFNANEITLEELCMLPGIDEEAANIFISYREAKGKISYVNEVNNINGLSEDQKRTIIKHIYLGSRTA